VAQAAHDGDTVKIDVDGNLGTRFLAIDTAEVSFSFPGTDKFMNIHPYFKDYLANPFSQKYKKSEAFAEALGKDLVTYLQKKPGPNCAENHFFHAQKAHRHLESLIKRDLAATKPPESYRFFMAFAYEVIDRYGRLLCYLHQSLSAKERKKEELSYNEEMLQSGVAMPYFIFPNMRSFYPSQGILTTIVEPEKFKKLVEHDKRLTQARSFVKTARKQKTGTFLKENPLKLEPFELRYLARRQPPDRWVIDLTQHKPTLLKPTHYYKIPNAEDRLFIPKECVPSFHMRGY
jgi:hypothetical protein